MTVFPLNTENKWLVTFVFRLLFTAAFLAVGTGVLLLYAKFRYSEQVELTLSIESAKAVLFDRPAWNDAMLALNFRWLLCLATVWAMFGTDAGYAQSFQGLFNTWIRYTLNAFLLPFALSAIAGVVLGSVFNPSAGATAAMAAFALYALAHMLTDELGRASYQPQLIRGRYLHSAPRNATTKGNPSEHLLYFGGHLLPIEEHHFLFAGTTRSGKSLSIAMLLRSAFEAQGQRMHMAILDAKYQTLPELVGIGIPIERIRLLNPFDARGVSWDIAKDVHDASSAQELSRHLIPEEKGGAQIWLQGSRSLIEQAVNVFNIVTPGAWSLNDLVQLFRVCTPEELRVFYAQSPTAKGVHAKYLAAHAEMAASFMATLEASMGQLAVAAGLWKDAGGQAVSIREWVNDNDGVIVFAVDTSRSQGLEAINRSMMTLLMTSLVQRPERDTENNGTWFVMDELASAGRFTKLQVLMEKAASKGVRVVLGAQSIDGLYAAYGNHDEVKALTGQCPSVALFRFNDPTSREWASKMMGEQEVRKRSFGESQSNQGGSSSQNYADQRQPMVLESEFGGITLPTREAGLTGYYVTNNEGAWTCTIPGAEVATRMPQPSSVPGFEARQIPVPDAHAWTVTDKKRFGAYLDDDQSGAVSDERPSPKSRSFERRDRLRPLPKDM